MDGRLTVANAFVCANCDCLGINPRCCEFCMSIAIWPLEAWLNRTAIEPQATSQPEKRLQ